MRILVILCCVFLASCSTTNSIRATKSIESIRVHEPFALQVSADSPQIEKLLAEYLSFDFGKYLKIGKPPNGTIEVLFTTHDQENEYSKWQNSTMLLIIKSKDGERLWTAEYNYKGGMELSGFSVNSPAEAAKLVTKRISEKFASDFSLR